MKSSKEQELAHKLVNYSCKVKSGDKVWLEYSGCTKSFVCSLINEILDVGGIPYVKCKDLRVFKSLVQNGSEQVFDELAQIDAHIMQQMDCVILVKGEHNIYELKDVDDKKIHLFDKTYTHVVHVKHRLTKRWVLLKFPTEAFAQLSKMSTEEFEEYFYDVCNLDYSKMCIAMDNLIEVMGKTNNVRIVAKDTDLTFSIKDISAVKCCGQCNIPDGECYTAPVKDSVNGYITFNIPAMYNGVEHNNIRLEFECGKIVKATSSNTEHLNLILDTDDGARYLGEFAFGVNPYIDKPINDILFDEKMCKSIHFACGNAYADANNGNISAIHWDLIQSHDDCFGGGEIYFDNKLIRKNGEFVIDKLVALNVNNLI